MTTWEVKLRQLLAYGQDRQSDGALFDVQADEAEAELSSLASGMSVDPRFTEALGLQSAAVADAAKLDKFTDDMADGIQSYGKAAQISHETYGGADVTAAQELDRVQQLLS